MVKKNRVFWMFFMVLAFFLLSVCSKKKSTEPEPTTDKWTILGYFDGNNSEDITSGRSYVIRDVQEMEQVGSSEDIQIIVMLSSIKTEGNCNYYFIEKYLDDSLDLISSQVLDSLGKKDMSDPQTLRDFIKYGVEHYPADHYMLIINDDGSAWKGVCSDYQNGDGTMMTLPELSSALSGYNFEIIVIKASSMSMLEVAYQLKDKANYLLASQYRYFKQNILGFPIWLQSLTNNPNISVGSLAQKIAIAIHTTAGVPNSISAIDLSKVDALTSKVADFGSLLVSHTGDDWKEVLDAREAPSSPVYFHYFDLKRFCQNIQSSANLHSTIKSAAQAVENANEVAVVKTLSSEPELGYGGLCIHFPREPWYFDSTRYVRLAFAVSNWHMFLSEFIKAYTEVNLLGSLRVTSKPVGARIYLDEEYTGFVTDTTIHELLTGYYTVKVVKEGYKEAERRAFVHGGDTTKVSFWLFPLPPL